VADAPRGWLLRLTTIGLLQRTISNSAQSHLIS
jgi:hypothetical protein